MGLKNIICGLCWLFTGVSVSVAQTEVGYRQKGKVSYYADKFQGRKTASGEKFNNQEMTAAHRKLPFNTMVKVVNPANGKSCLVRINDRGPYSKERVLDLSRSAAQQLGILQAGWATVNIEVVGLRGEVKTIPSKGLLAEEKNGGDERQRAEVEVALILERQRDEEKKMAEDEVRRMAEDAVRTAEAARLASEANFKLNQSYSAGGVEKAPAGFGVQVGAYHNLDDAKDTAGKLFQSSAEEVYIRVMEADGGKVYRVLAGAFDKRATARKFLAVVEKAGYACFVKRHAE
ncbi:MAG: septal ring lytic transglycosylase RlpA family protein [Ferruginibacter sp.]|nr:septal ring lytic transglycosylase RlpA family protein [Cytophagales bacterium]